jgi:hypothetical protein
LAPEEPEGLAEEIITEQKEEIQHLHQYLLQVVDMVLDTQITEEQGVALGVVAAGLVILKLLEMKGDILKQKGRQVVLQI